MRLGCCWTLHVPLKSGCNRCNLEPEHQPDDGIVADVAQEIEFERLLAKERSDAKMGKTGALITAKKDLNEGRRAQKTETVFRLYPFARTSQFRACVCCCAGKLAVDFLFKQQTLRRAAQKTIAWEADSFSPFLYGTQGIGPAATDRARDTPRRFSIAGAM